MTAVILASASPRRRQLLSSIGVTFVVQPADIDETEHAGEYPVPYVERISKAKALAAVGRLGMGAIDDVVVLAADTTVDVDGTILAKPLDDDEARRMLGLLSGRTHQVHTAVYAWRVSGFHTVTVTTDVTFEVLDEARIDWYLSLGEHLDTAGAYGMQSAGAALVRRIAGSPSNVIGLPLAETIGVLRACGVAVAGRLSGR
ncbi:MAG: Maf family protein [Ilumatobacteraceae bacterium]